MSEPAPPPVPGLEDLSALGNVMDRFEILTGTVNRLAVAYYQNLVLKVYAGLRYQPQNQFARMVADESPALDQQLIFGGPDPDADVMWSIAKAWQTRSGPGLTGAEVDVLLRSRIETTEPAPFTAYLRTHLAARGGYPERGAQRWMGHLERTRILLEDIPKGVYVDFAIEGRTPEELRTGHGARALSVEQSIQLWNNRERALTAAESDYDAAILHWKVADSTERAQIRERMKRISATVYAAQQRAAEARHAVQDTSNDFYAAFGPGSRPPRSGRGRRR